MIAKKNAPAGVGEGACQLGGDTEIHSTQCARRQAVLRCGVPVKRADLMAQLAFGDLRA